ncbi:hypothetical protein VTL71DRAFT_10432 [Oculimacula yallundae]|uniref:JmjC domain-containing protein n=1 Tax=Oculimacula yallundae TaxID=86028 RepID=A0ABR4CTK6_9HELO
MSSSDDISTLLRRLDDFGAITRQSVEGLQLSTIQGMPPDQQDLWTESTTTWPHIFEADECWKKKAPTSEELIYETLDLITARKAAEKRKKVDDYQVYIALYSQGLVDSDLDPRKAIAQLHEPDKSNPVGLIGYRLPKFISDTQPGLVTPAALSRFVEPFNEDNRQVLCTPKFWTTDLHIDNYDGLSTIIGSCEKLWIMFPPTRKNLHLMQVADGQRSKLARIGKDLEGGVVLAVDSSQALYIPAGCLHAVFTLHGGFLITMEFTTSISVKVLSSLLNAQFDRFKDHWLQSELPGQFIESVELALTQNQVQAGVDAWIHTQSRLKLWFDKEQDSSASSRNQHWVDRRSGWEKKVREVWDTFFRSQDLDTIRFCPCGEMGHNARDRVMSFKEHFYSKHLVVDRKEVTADLLEANRSKTKKRKTMM